MWTKWVLILETWPGGLLEENENSWKCWVTWENGRTKLYQIYIRIAANKWHTTDKTCWYHTVTTITTDNDVNGVVTVSARSHGLLHVRVERDVRRRDHVVVWRHRVTRPEGRWRGEGRTADVRCRSAELLGLCRCGWLPAAASARSSRTGLSTQSYSYDRKTDCELTGEGWREKVRWGFQPHATVTAPCFIEFSAPMRLT